MEMEQLVEQMSDTCIRRIRVCIMKDEVVFNSMKTVYEL